MKPSRHGMSEVWTRVCPGRRNRHGSGWELGQEPGAVLFSLLPLPTRAVCHAIPKWGPNTGNGDRAARHKCSPLRRDSKTEYPHYCKLGQPSPPPTSEVQVGKEAVGHICPHLYHSSTKVTWDQPPVLLLACPGGRAWKTGLATQGSSGLKYPLGPELRGPGTSLLAAGDRCSHLPLYLLLSLCSYTNIS